MNYSEFVSKYLGKSTDYDGAYGVQCVDLIKAYLHDVFGVTAGSWGNARFYWINFALHAPLKANFDKIKNTAQLVPKRGDIVVWNNSVGNGCGHIAIATGEGDTRSFYSYEQNWNSKPMKKVKHTYAGVYGVLRPKDQSKVAQSSGNASSASNGSYPTPITWRNGSTPETVYAVNDCTDKIGTVYAKSTAQCYSKAGSCYLIVYSINGGKAHKAGFVAHAGGLNGAPPQSRAWKNGNTAETVYADTAKGTRIGSIDKYESCYCLGKIDGMYLVLYKVNGTNKQKCGFVGYHG